jgi:hypothetical protein
MDIILTQFVKCRYEKMMETIAEWENEKNVKARRKKEQKEVFLLFMVYKKQCTVSIIEMCVSFAKESSKILCYKS